MAIIFMDSFDHYTTMTQKYDATFNANGSNAPAITGGRFGNGCRMSGATVGASDNYFAKFLSPSAGYTTIVVGMAFLYTSAGTNTEILGLYETGTSHITVNLNAAKQLYITRGGTQIGATGTTVLATGVWYHIELKTTIHDTTGTAALRLNGLSEIATFTGDTRNAGTTGAINRVYFFATTASGGSAYNQRDDIIIQGDNAGTSDWLGDLRVQAILPDGNGNSSQFDGSDNNTTDNYLLVDETPASTADFVQSATVGNKDTYTFSDLSPTAGVVYGVQVLPFLNKTDAGVRNAASVARLAGVEEDSADKVLSTSAQYMPDIRETKPGGGAWSITDVNNAEFGVKVTA